MNDIVVAKIKMLRHANCVDRVDMAKFLKVSLSGYGKIERGEVELTINRLAEIAKKFDVPIATFFEKDIEIFENINRKMIMGNINNSENPDKPSDFDYLKYIEFLEKRISWLKLQLKSEAH